MPAPASSDPTSQPRRRARRGRPQPYRTASGRWRVEVELPRSDGRGRRRRTFSGRSKAEVERKRRAYQPPAATEPTPRAGRVTLAAVLDAWLTAIDLGDRDDAIRASTWRSYEGHVRLHIVPWLGEVAMRDLTIERIESWLAALQAAGVSQAMRRKVHTTLRTATKWAITAGFASRSVAAEAKLPRRPRRRPWVPLAEAELRAMVAAFATHRLGALFLIALELGPRLGELLALRWTDVDVEQRMISIGHTLAWHPGSDGGPARPVAEDTKTEASTRVLRVPDDAWSALMAHRERQERERLAAGAGWTEWGLVFTRAKGAPLRGDGTGGVGDQLARLLGRAGLPRRNFHQLRHQAATLMLALGANLHDVQKILGHASIRQTADLYGHLVPEVRERVAGRVADYFAGLRLAKGA